MSEQKVDVRQNKMNGPMPSYDDPKPTCIKCKAGTWVVAVGRTDNWTWTCLNCVTEFHENNLSKK